MHANFQKRFMSTKQAHLASYNGYSFLKPMFLAPKKKSIQIFHLAKFCLSEAYRVWYTDSGI